MRARSKLGVGVLAAAAATAGGLVVAPSAPAQPATASAAAVPSCIWAEVDDQGWRDIITIHNDCGQSIRVKVVLDFAFDSCITAPAGDSRYQIQVPARFNRLDDC